MIVKDLIEKLKTFDENCNVYTEGCDCIGFANAVEDFDLNALRVAKEKFDEEEFDEEGEPDGPRVIIRREGRWCFDTSILKKR